MPHIADPSSVTGVELIKMEMQRQHVDAVASLDGAVATANLIAASVQRTGRLLLIGMGGSHCINRSAEALYRSLGVETLAITASEQLYQPMPKIRDWTKIYVSQSGGSAEVIRLINEVNSSDAFGITLDTQGALATALPCLIGAGGPETAYAATRSFMVTLALHAAVLEALGSSQADMRAVLTRPTEPIAIKAALRPLANVNNVIFSGRGALVGIAEAGALGLLELARMPGFAIEGGQFRHGPIEALNSKTGVVLLRANDACAHLSEGLAGICMSAGATPVVLDASGRSSITGCVTIRLPPLSALSAIVAILPPLQTILLEVAQSRVKNVGIPIRAQKITDTE